MTPKYTVKGVQDRLEVHENKVTITPKGLMGLINKGLKGTKEIPFTSITALQFKKAGFTNGYLQFTLPGGNESKGGLRAAIKDENTFVFSILRNKTMVEVKQFIDKRIEELRTPQQQHSQVNLSDELKKLADLQAQGALSTEEFQAAKARLLTK